MCKERKKVSSEPGGHPSPHVGYIHAVFSSILWEMVSSGPWPLQQEKAEQLDIVDILVGTGRAD